MASGVNIKKLKDESYLKLQLANRELKELKKTLKTTEFQLARTKIENESLSNSMQETDDLNKVLEGSMENQSAINQRSQTEIGRLNAALEETRTSA